LKKRHIALRLPGILCLCIARTASSRVRSGRRAIRPNRKSACFSNGETLPPRGLAVQRPVSRKHLTQIIAVLALTSNSSAAARRDAPLSTSANPSRPHVFRIGLRHRPASQNRINADRLSHPSPSENLLDSIGTEHALVPRRWRSPQQPSSFPFPAGLDGARIPACAFIGARPPFS